MNTPLNPTPQDIDLGDDGSDIESENAPGQTPIVPAVDNSDLEYDYSAPLAELDPAKEAVVIASTSFTGLSELNKQIAQGGVWRQPVDKNVKTIWANVLSASVRSMPADSGLMASINDPSRKWVKAVDSPTGPLRSTSPRLRIKPGAKIGANHAREYAMQALNMGQMFSTALWHSGFWVRLRAPSESAMLELHRKIQAEKVTLGRLTWGLLFSNASSYYSRVLLDFVMDHVHDTSVDLPEDKDLRELIMVHDLPILYWGLAKAHWTNGFQYSRPCIADPDKCMHISHGKLNLQELLRQDDTAFTAYQRKHMGNVAPRSMSLASIQSYRDEMLRGSKSKVNLKAGGGSVEVVFKTPTALQHLGAGQLWIDNIEKSTPESLGLPVDERDDFIWAKGKATTMRQYAHYVDSIIVGDQNFSQEETVYELLDMLSADDTVRDEFLKAVAHYIDESVVAMVAIQTYVCPSCGTRQNAGRDKSKFPDYIPLDPGAIFFSLVAQRVAMIAAR
jgi:hypothetical protein